MKGLCIATLLAVSAVPALAAECMWPSALWDGQLTGARLAANPELHACVDALSRDAASRLVIRHGMGDEATLEAAELRYWLLALALDPARVEMREDADLRGPLQLSVRGSKP